jgi:hypothetical protein
MHSFVIIPHLAFRCLTFPAMLRYPGGPVQKLRQPPHLFIVNVGLLTRSALYVAYLLRLLPQGVGLKKGYTRLARALERSPRGPGLRPVDVRGIRAPGHPRNVNRLILVLMHLLILERIPARQRQGKNKIVVRATLGVIGNVATVAHRIVGVTGRR